MVLLFGELYQAFVTNNIDGDHHIVAKSQRESTILRAYQGLFKFLSEEIIYSTSSFEHLMNDGLTSERFWASLGEEGRIPTMYYEARAILMQHGL